jgi:hypothetical protein
VLAAAEALSALAALLTLLAILSQGPVHLMLLMTVGPALVGIGILFYLGVAVADFLRRRVVSQMHFAPGETIFRQGDPADRIYAVMTGEVEVIREESEGKETVLTRLGPGQYFGHMHFSDTPRMTTVRTVTPVEVVSLPLAHFMQILALPDFRRVAKKAVTQSPDPTVGKS